jgi:transposase
LEEILRQHLPRDHARTRLPTVTALLVLVRNLLLSREPIYGVGEWACGYAPELLGLTADQLGALGDDRLGRCLECLFAVAGSDLILDVVRHVVGEFALGLDELHNDSTTVSFFGAYREAEEEGTKQGRPTVAITYGHSKARRPDLKQLLYVLTVTDDGGVPVCFTTKSGNVVDDRTHCETWNLMRELFGGPEFLYVADCKLASTDNMKYIDRQGGRFVTVLPATRKEDHRFRARLGGAGDGVTWDRLYDVRDEQNQVVDELCVCPEETLSKEKYRLCWFHSTRKARRDAVARLGRTQQAIARLQALRERLRGPRPRLRTSSQVEPAVAEILRDTGSEGLLRVEVRAKQTEHYRQTTPGRPGKNTQYVKQTKSCCDLAWQLDTEAITAAERGDGVFPLITNTHDLTAEEMLRAYKRQPIIEKRFSQLKTDFAVAPVYLKSVSRIQALLCLYFFALMVQTLLERQLRQAMQAAGLESLPLYPEGRACKAPTARRVIDVFQPLQRHTLESAAARQTFTPELSPLQGQLLELLDVPSDHYTA